MYMYKENQFLYVNVFKTTLMQIPCIIHPLATLEEKRNESNTLAFIFLLSFQQPKLSLKLNNSKTT